MDTNVKAQLKEADKNYKTGKEAITTGVFRWTKDYNFAVTHFEDAAKLYKLCKAYEKQINCLKLAVECNEKLNDNWAVARNYEAIIQSWIENNPELNVQELIDITRRSGIYFKAADSAHNTLNLYVKVAKYLMQKKNNKEAEELIIEALQEAEEQQVPSTRIDILNQYVEILMQTSRFDAVGKLFVNECEKNKGEPNKYPLNQYALIVVIMYLLQDEVIRANSELERLIILVPNFHKSSEFKVCDQFLNAYEKADQASFDEAATRSCVTSIYPPIIVRLLRKVKVRAMVLQPKTKEINLQQQQQQQQQQVPSYLEDNDNPPQQTQTIEQMIL